MPHRGTRKPTAEALAFARHACFQTWPVETPHTMGFLVSTGLLRPCHSCEWFRLLPFRADIGCVRSMIARVMAIVQDPSLVLSACEASYQQLDLVPPSKCEVLIVRFRSPRIDFIFVAPPKMECRAYGCHAKRQQKRPMSKEV